MMMRTMTYDPFSIVTVPFPFVDKNQQKRRPAVVVSSKEHQTDTQYITLLMITSAKNSEWPSDYLITGLKNTGLTSPSIIRQKLFTIDLRLVIKTIGTLSTKDKNMAIKKLKKHLLF
jgi:mRNA interferase MazF